MGMYTELFVEGTLRSDAPDEVVRIVRYLFDKNADEDVLPVDLPGDRFFECDRWKSVGNCSSSYHIPFSLSGVHVPHTGQLSFISRSDLKNYDNEIQKFVDWITPYCERLRGWSLYEEDEEPTVFTYENYGA